MFLVSLSFFLVFAVQQEENFAGTYQKILPNGFVSAAQLNKSGKRLVPDQRVWAFSQTIVGRVLFNEQGAYFPAEVHRERHGRSAVDKGDSAVKDQEMPMVFLSTGFESNGKRIIEPLLKQPLSGTMNFLIGPEENWQIGLACFGELIYPSVWPGIDLVFEARGSGLGYRLEVAEGADPTSIEMTTGAGSLILQEDGSLYAERSGAWLKIGKPQAFQLCADQKKEVEVNFKLGEEGRYSFNLGPFDPSLPLTIDPSLTWSTYLGGSGEDSGHSFAIDDSGSVYVTGYTPSPNFPTTAGSLDPSHNGNVDIFVSKLSSDGSSLVYSTFLGGSLDDYGFSIALDSSGAAYITGSTNSVDFPTTVGAYDTSHNGDSDILVCKLSTDGSTLIYSTFLGGSSNENGEAVVLDNTGSVYVTGSTQSTDVPTTPGVYDTSHNGDSDVWVCKLSPDGASLVYSTYLGALGDDYGREMVIDSSGAAYIAGHTFSSDFPTTLGAFDPSHNGASDVFVSKLSEDGSTLVYSTFLGGSGFIEGCSGIALDSSGSAYVTGYTSSPNFPTTAGAFDTSHSGSLKTFISKLNGNASALLYSTFLGGTGGDAGLGITLSSGGSAFVTGYTYSPDFPTTMGAYDTSHNGDYDAFISKLNADGSTLLYSTFLGGSSEDFGVSIALDSSEMVFVIGGTESTNFPTTIGSYDSGMNGVQDVFVSKLCPIAKPGPILGPNAVCAGESGTYSIDPVSDAVDYSWNVPPGSTISAGQGTTSITVDFGTLSGEISVFANAGCSGERQVLPISVHTGLSISLSPPGAAQGVHFLVLEGAALCGTPGYEVQWTNLTSGLVYGIDENPITIDPILTETSTFEFRVTDGQKRATNTAQVPVLVNSFGVLDWDGNGCSEMADLWQAIQLWRATYPGDPNDDGFLDIRDFLYINTDGCSFDPILGSLLAAFPSTFTQGSPESEPCRFGNETQFSHTLTRGLLVMETEVTRQMWTDLLTLQPSLPPDPTNVTYSAGMNHPVQSTTWNEAILFANLLSLERGLTPCYYKDAGFTDEVNAANYTSGDFYCDFDAEGYRLPTEGEWEYLARAATTGTFFIEEPNYTSGTCGPPYCIAGEFPGLESIAVFCANHPTATLAVGSKAPNPWGLRDVFGNVWEWCWDWYEVYPSGSIVDYTGASSGTFRVARGGGFNYDAVYCRSAARGWDSPTVRQPHLGFRLVRTYP